MLRSIKIASLQMLRGCGMFEVVANSSWRGQRLLILCYHGVSLEDEHLWRPSLYITPELLKIRFDSLRRGKYSVLPLTEALSRLNAGTLPSRSVALTFDDGTFDFYRQATPLLNEYGFPATVYLTTYYAIRHLPVFNLICSYMLWKRRGVVIDDAEAIGVHEPLNLQTEAGRHKVVRALIDSAESAGMSGEQKDDVAERLANFLGIDYAALKSKRILQIMNEEEVRATAQRGIDVQLHTHRHRTPENEELFTAEIRENRELIETMASTHPQHFCYPGGVYRKPFLPWLAAQDVVSATTCDAGLCHRGNEPLLLPRFVDNQSRTQVEFESWTSGVGDWLAFQKAASQKYVPRD